MREERGLLEKSPGQEVLRQKNSMGKGMESPNSVVLDVSGRFRGAGGRE